MKKEFNRADIVDVPLDHKITNNISSAPKKNKPKITRIGNNRPIPSTKPIEPDTPKKSKLADNSISNRDLESINEENLKVYAYRGTRNRVIIISLVVLIILTIVGMLLYSLTLESNENCFLYLDNKNVNAHYVVNNEKVDAFRTPNGLRNGTVYDIDIALRINSSGNYMVEYRYECYVDGKLANNVLNYDVDWDLFRLNTATNTYYTITPVSGNSTVKLTGGLALQPGYKDIVSANNFEMKVYTKVYKV